MADTNNIEQTTEVIKSIPELVNAISTVIQTPSGFFITVLVVVWLLFNRDFSNFFNLLERKESKRLEKLEAYIVSNTDSSNCLNIIKEQRDAYYFEVATGIYAEKTLRDAYIELHNTTSYRISWTTIRRALVYMELDDFNKIFIRDKKWHEKLGVFYNYLISLFCVLSSVGTMLVVIFSSGLSFVEILKLILFVIFFAAMSLFLFAQNFPDFASKKIQGELNASLVSGSEI